MELFKLVNLAVLREEDGKQFLEIGIDDPASPVTAGLGPGLYGLFVSTKPMGVVSGTVTLDGAPTGDAIVVGTEAPFLSVADAKGHLGMPVHPPTIAPARYDQGCFGQSFHEAQGPPLHELLSFMDLALAMLGLSPTGLHCIIWTFRSRQRKRGLLRISDPCCWSDS